MIAIIAILAAMLLPGLARAKEQANGVVCLNNQKQMVLAWIMYADDNRDWFVPNHWHPTEANRAWVFLGKVIEIPRFRPNDF